MASTRIATDRLNSWKDIASYLHCDVRTAIRWEKAKGLPVHRIPGGQRQSVFAYPEEIDLWLAGKQEAKNPVERPPVPSVPQTSEASSANRSTPKFRWTRTGLIVVCAGAAVLLLAGIAARVTGHFFAPPPLRLTGLTQISHDYMEKNWLLSDGTQLYFGEERDGRLALAAMPVDGGHTRVLWNPPANVFPEDMSPDGRQLLACTYVGVEKERELWIVPADSGDARSSALPRRLGELTGHSAAWSPDGKQIAFATGRRIYLTSESGAVTRELGSFNGIPDKLRWSPDGRHLRFLLLDPATLKASYWELSSSNGMATTTLSALQFQMENCCGQWSRASGRDSYFLTADDPSPNASVWLLQAGGKGRRTALRTTELHTGLGGIQGIAYSNTAQRLFLLSELPSRSALVRFDPRTQEFRYILPGISGKFVDYSRDGHWIAYARPEDNTLWVSRADGRDARQLTYPPENVELPRWSPDGKSIAYMAKQDDNPWRIYIVPRDGSPVREASEGEDQQGAPTWSPDGRFLVYGSVECIASHSCAIHRIDLSTGRVQTLPGSEGLQTARWSPDGRFVVAQQPEQHQLFLFDLHTQHWRKLADGIDGNDVSWSNDSKAVYASCLGGDSRIVRISVAGGKVETVIDLKSTDAPNLSQIADAWFTVAPHGSIILRYWQHASEIYAYDLRRP